MLKNQYNQTLCATSKPTKRIERPLEQQKNGQRSLEQQNNGQRSLEWQNNGQRSLEQQKNGQRSLEQQKNGQRSLDWIESIATTWVEDTASDLIVQTTAPRDLDFEREGKFAGHFFVQKNKRDGCVFEQPVILMDPADSLTDRVRGLKNEGDLRDCERRLAELTSAAYFNTKLVVKELKACAKAVDEQIAKQETKETELIGDRECAERHFEVLQKALAKKRRQVKCR